MQATVFVVLSSEHQKARKQNKHICVLQRRVRGLSRKHEMVVKHDYRKRISNSSTPSNSIKNGTRDLFFL